MLRTLDNDLFYIYKPKFILNNIEKIHLPRSEDFFLGGGGLSEGVRGANKELCNFRSTQRKFSRLTDGRSLKLKTL